MILKVFSKLNDFMILTTYVEGQVSKSG